MLNTSSDIKIVISDAVSPIRINHWETNGRNKNKRRKSDLSRYTGGTFWGSMASTLKRYIRVPSCDSPCTSSTSHPPHTLSSTIYFNAVVWFLRIFSRIILFVDEKKIPSISSLYNLSARAIRFYFLFQPFSFHYSPFVIFDYRPAFFCSLSSPRFRIFTDRFAMSDFTWPWFTGSHRFENPWRPPPPTPQRGSGFL